MTNSTIKVNIQKVESSIEMINKYVSEIDVSGVIDVLEALIKTPEDNSLLLKLTESLQPLGIWRGAVLNYAPYVAILVSYDLFDEED